MPPARLREPGKGVSRCQTQGLNGLGSCKPKVPISSGQVGFDGKGTVNRAQGIVPILSGQLGWHREGELLAPRARSFYLGLYINLTPLYPDSPFEGVSGRELREGLRPSLIETPPFPY
jgi:hypothetical protein